MKPRPLDNLSRESYDKEPMKKSAESFVTLLAAGVGAGAMLWLFSWEYVLGLPESARSKASVFWYLLLLPGAGMIGGGAVGLLACGVLKRFEGGPRG